MKLLIKTVVFSLGMMLTLAPALQAQESKDDTKNVTANAISRLVASRNFVFVAETVSPTGGGMRQLNSLYDLVVSGDTIVSALPYFGRAYSAPMSSSDAGINFRSTDFTYKINEKEKGGWDIEIEPKNVSSAKTMHLFISDNGYASLQVISNNRQPISFSGQVRERNWRK